MESKNIVIFLSTILVAHNNVFVFNGFKNFKLTFLLNFASMKFASPLISWRFASLAVFISGSKMDLIYLTKKRTNNKDLGEYFEAFYQSTQH